MTLCDHNAVTGLVILLALSFAVNMLDRRQIWRRVRNGKSPAPPTYNPDEYDKT